MLLFWAALGVLATLPLYFVYNRVYKDGVIGRMALLAISFNAWVILLDTFLGDEATKYHPTPPAVGLTLAVAGFLVWHLYRFHYRVVQRMDKTCACETERRTTPDRRFIT